MNKNIFISCAKEVVKMNKLFRDSQFHDKLLIENQRKFIYEETIEMLHRGIKEKNKKEFVDGLADLFVTGIFLEYLLCDSEQDFIYQLNTQVSEPKTVISFDNLVNLSMMIHSITAKGRIIDLIYQICSFVDMVADYQEDEKSLMDLALIEVNRSNMSKFPMFNTLTENDILQDIEYIKDKKQLDKVGYIVKNGRVTYLDLNINKFQKPRSFSEPDLEFVNQIENLKPIMQIVVD